MKTFNKLSASQCELLDLLQEECAEVIQAISKIKRHGYYSFHPNGGESNKQSLEREIGDVYAAIQLLVDKEEIDNSKCLERKMIKLDSVFKYLHHNSKP